MKEEDLENKLSLKKNDDELVLIGCSPCQFWSIINTDKNKSEKSKDLLKEFRKFVEYFTPGYVVVENVPGVFRRKKESGLDDFINWLELNNYAVHFNVHEVSNYGVPQHRRRFTLIANSVRLCNNLHTVLWTSLQEKYSLGYKYIIFKVCNTDKNKTDFS